MGFESFKSESAEQNRAEQLNAFQEGAKFEYERLATPKFEKLQLRPDQEQRIEKEFPRVKAPENIELVKKLQSKFKEYRGRIRDEIERNPSKSREILTDTHYKAFILEKLLTEGEVNSDLNLELITKFGGFVDKDALKNAWAVIGDYAKTGGKNIEGGTGLK